MRMPRRTFLCACPCRAPGWSRRRARGCPSWRRHGADSQTPHRPRHVMPQRQAAPVPSFGQWGMPQPESAAFAPLDEADDSGPNWLQIGADFGADVASVFRSMPRLPNAASYVRGAWLASPRKTSDCLARLNQRCVSLSNVKPMPPCICTA